MLAAARALGGDAGARERFEEAAREFDLGASPELAIRTREELIADACDIQGQRIAYVDDDMLVGTD